MLNINYHKNPWTVALFSIAGLTLLPGAAHGQVEMTNDMVYLLTTADTNRAPADFLDHVTAKVVLICPSYPFILGFELGIEIENQVNTNLTASFPVLTSTDCSPIIELGFWDVVATYSTPLPATDFVTLATIDLFYLDSIPSISG